jgi:pimeloyl-ACP methyl ester carboxylesterase
MSNQTQLILLVVLLAALVACKPADPTSEPTAVPAPTEAATAAPTEVPVPVPDPEDIQMELADGSLLAGTYYPPAITPAPGIVLVHEPGLDRSSWEPLLQRLTAQALPGGGTYAVLAYDLPGHGGSEGRTTAESVSESIRVALETLYENPDVNTRIIIIGAGAGADGAVSECGLGCIGAVSLSPGDYLGIQYTVALNDVIRAKGGSVLCLAADLDFPTPGTCEGGAQVNMRDYYLKVYNGYAHGTGLFAPDLRPEPLPLDLIMAWLASRHPLR